MFGVVKDSPGAHIVVLQGEQQLSKDNKILGEFQIDCVSLVKGEVTFDIDVTGILSVSAKDKATGKEQTIAIANYSALDATSLLLPLPVGS